MISWLFTRKKASKRRNDSYWLMKTSITNAKIKKNKISKKIFWKGSPISSRWRRGWGGVDMPPHQQQKKRRHGRKRHQPQHGQRYAARFVRYALNIEKQRQQRRNIEKQGTRQGWHNIATFIYIGTASTAQKRRAVLLSLSLLICLLI